MANGDLVFFDLLDIAFMAVVVYILLIWFKRTRTGLILAGIAIFTGFYLVAIEFNLTLTASFFENFFAIFLIALVVIFQEELRQLFEGLAVWSVNRQFMRRRVLASTREEVQTLVRTVFDLAKSRVGAIIVLRGQDLMSRHLHGGTDLDGRLSEALLKSIFDPHSPGHDGAVILDHGRVTQFSVHLPLSRNLGKTGTGGTRHAAALGLAELTDALCLVVSEERGVVSVARRGDIEPVTQPERLGVLLEKFYQETQPAADTSAWKRHLKKNSWEKLFAVVFAVAIWFVFDHGSKVIYKSYAIPIQYPELPQPLVMRDVTPRTVEVTIRGPRKEFYFLRHDRLQVTVEPRAKVGSQTIRLSPQNISVPDKTVLESFDPKTITFSIEQPAPKEEGKEKPKAPKEKAAKPQKKGK